MSLTAISGPDSFGVSDEYDIYADGIISNPQVESVKTIRHYPVSSIENARVVDIQIPGNGLECLLFWRTLVELKFVVEKKANGAKLTAADAGLLVNLDSNVMNSIIKEQIVYFNEVQVDSTNGMHSYSTDIDQKLTYGNEYLDSQGRMYGVFVDKDPNKYFKRDASGSGTDAVAKAEMNKQAEERARWINNSKEVTLLGPLINAFTSQKKMLPTNVNVRVKFILNDDAKVLVSPTATQLADYTYKVKSMCLLVKKAKLHDSDGMALETAFRRKPIKYQVQKTLTTYQTIPANIQQQVFENVFTGKSPSLIVCTFLKEGNFRGNHESSYFYEDFGLETLKISLDSDTELKQPMRFDIATKQYHEGYQSLIEACNIFRKNAGIAITPSHYMNGKSIPNDSLI
jgi:hypothetical protein